MNKPTIALILMGFLFVSASATADSRDNPFLKPGTVNPVAGPAGEIPPEIEPPPPPAYHQDPPSGARQIGTINGYAVFHHSESGRYVLQALEARGGSQ
ncbi:hypothetical protein [Thioalkalivibrio thiocyanodenitrificans]|uniref:hypothetical protein n=1 Tax=Thioalkalivibrio thiocyanodenitrificans TaxID=243063 RepID=UPI00037441E2|nr:hypothetical protein [Thioalkalivibrio thiocyanodenitrificans]